MSTLLENFKKTQLKNNLPDIRPGDTVRVYQKTKEKKKERIQIFEGIVIAKKHGKGISGTITVRTTLSGVGVEKIFPIHSPFIKEIKIVKRSKVRRAKLYYLRGAKGKKARLKRKDFIQKPSQGSSKEPEPETKEAEQEKIEKPATENK